MDGLGDVLQGLRAEIVRRDREFALLHPLQGTAIEGTTARGPVLIDGAEPSGQTGAGLIEDLLPAFREKFDAEPGEFLRVITPLKFDVAEKDAVATKAARRAKLVNGTHG